MKKIIYNRKTVNKQFIDNKYDDMKNMLNIVRSLNEQVENEIEVEDDETDEFKRKTVEEELTKEYSVSGGKIIVHGATEKDLVLTEEEKSAFQETMEQFNDEVSDMANVEWSGDLLQFDVRFYYSIAEVEGTYIGNANMIKVNDKFMEVLKDVKDYYATFQSKWAKILSDRRTTNIETGEGLGGDNLSNEVEMDSGVE